LALSLAERSFNHGNYEALTGLAWTYMLSKDPDRAFGVMTYAMKLGFPDAVSELMALSTMVDDVDRTLTYCELAEQTGGANALRIAGGIHARFGNERRAASLLWRASNVSPDHWASFRDTYAGAAALQELGELRESQGRIRSARRIYRQLVRRGNNYALVKLAASYEQAGASAQAEQLAEAYERAAAPNPSNAGWLAVAEARHERGDVDGGERLLWALVEDGDTHVLRKIADLRLKIGDRSGAEEVLRLAVDCAVPGAKESMSKLEQAD
jgi:tetratricopeptide (TPR) repeat protein